MGVRRNDSSWVLVSVLIGAIAWAEGCGSQSETDGGSAFVTDASVDATNREGGISLGDSSSGSSGGVGSGASTGVSSGANGGGNPCVAPASLAISPNNSTASVSVGTPFAQTFTVTATYANGSTSDVTAQSFLTLSSSNLGAL